MARVGSGSEPGPPLPNALGPEAGGHTRCGNSEGTVFVWGPGPSAVRPQLAPNSPSLRLPPGPSPGLHVGSLFSQQDEGAAFLGKCSHLARTRRVLNPGLGAGSGAWRVKPVLLQETGMLSELRPWRNTHAQAKEHPRPGTYFKIFILLIYFIFVIFIFLERGKRNINVRVKCGSAASCTPLLGNHPEP